MVRLYENSKLKRFVTWLLLMSIVMSTFIASFTQPVYADATSNSRRMTSLNLAAKAGFGDISDIKSIDERSMQTIAIYLSNFYLPFITILDGDYTKENAEDSGNNQHVQAMKDALIKNCGFDKNVAEYLVGYALNQSLASCKPVYMKTSQLESCLDYTEYVDGRSYLGLSNALLFSGVWDYDFGSYEYANSIGALSNIYYTKEVTKAAGFLHGAEYGDWDYITTVGSVTVGGTDYTPISYAIFLGLMCNIDLSGRYGDYLKDVEFYCMQSNGSSLEMTPVFSNSTDCLLMLLQALQYCDVENGFSNGFCSISGTDVESIDDPEATQYSLVTCPNVYVNWEGSLIYDNGVYRTVILPGCMNPYMVNTWNERGVTITENIVPIPASTEERDGYIYEQGVYSPHLGEVVYVNADGTVDTSIFGNMMGHPDGTKMMRTTTRTVSGKWDTRPVFINNTSLSSIGLGLVSESRPLSFENIAFATYRVMIGNDQDNFDQSWQPGTWGENESIFELLEGIQYVGVTGSTGNDYARFPILTSSLEDDKIHVVSDNKRFANYEYSISKTTAASNLVWFDNYRGVTADTPLSGFFPTSYVFEDEFVTALRKYNIDTYAQFKNIKKQGHSLSYPNSTKMVFQNIYLTYCFACFNADYDTYDKDENIVNVRFNFKNFPEGNIDLDWTSIQQDQLANEVMSFVYYLLHPTEGVAYVTRLFKNKVSGILLGWHEDIVGGTSSNAATGMTKYLGTSSYTTMPNLKDISWVSGLLNIYNNIVVYLIILMCLILLCYVLTGSMTIQRGIVGVVLFGICAFLPPVAINGAVDLINTTSDTLFSKKFDFWAICQMQNFVDNYVDAMEAQDSGDFASYATFVISQQKTDLSLSSSDEEASAATFSGAKVKWMAPKKYNSLASLVQAVNEGTAMGNSSANFLKNSLLTMVAKSTSGETYLDDSESLYLYRDYADIYKYAHASYNILSTFNFKGDLGKGTETDWITDQRPLWIGAVSETNSSYGRAWNGITDAKVFEYVSSAVSTTLNSGTTKAETSSVDAISKGYLYNTIGFSYSGGTTTRYEYLVKQGETTRNTYAVSYLANYTKTFREVHDAYKRLQEVVRGAATIEVGTPGVNNFWYNFGLPKATGDSTNQNGSYLWGYQEILGLQDTELQRNNSAANTKVYKNLSDVYYGLYSESPFFFFNANIRDQVVSAGTGYSYQFPALNEGKTEGTNGEMNHVAKMFLKDNQDYFFNLVETAGDGYGELRDFTNMHDFFYFVIPYLREGVELARLYDDVFGLYVDEDCSLIINADGSGQYDGSPFKDLDELGQIITNANGKYTEEELYKLWHTYNTYTILSAYSPWIDTMLDCNYHKPETITVLGERFRVTDPLDPRTYYTVEGDVMTGGRYMVFSRSEMNAMGLTTADLTTVERKIIQFQDNVYNNTLNLMNYYTFSDEVMIQAYAMLQTFEFNKLFSQTSVVGESFVMYPQGYELKAFSYDAYLRMIVSGASGESLMFNGKDSAGNVSIYERVMKNTSLFFGIFLLINDILAVYVIPGLKIFFLVTIFFCSILILIGSVIKMEMNIISVLWKSLMAPLLSFSAVCIGLSLIVSMFMKTGANGVVSSEFIINVGDPTSAIILMIVLNVAVVILMFKICKKCFRDLITYTKAVFDNIGSTVVGAVGAVAGGFAAGRAMDKFKSGGGAEGGSGVSRTAKQRGRDNDPRSGRNGVGSAMTAGAVGAGVGAAVAGAAGSEVSGYAGAGYESMSSEAKRRLHNSRDRSEDSIGMNKYDKKAFDGATARQDAAHDKRVRDEKMLENAKGLRKARYELAHKLHTRQEESAMIKADNIKKYGTGIGGNGIGVAARGLGTVAGKGRKTRVEGLKQEAQARRAGREKASQTALQKQYDAQARANVRAKKEYARDRGSNRAKKGTSPNRSSSRKPQSNVKRRVAKQRQAAKAAKR